MALPPGPRVRRGGPLRSPAAAAAACAAAAVALVAGCTAGSAGPSATTAVPASTSAPAPAPTSAAAPDTAPAPSESAAPTSTSPAPVTSPASTGATGAPAHTVQITFSGWDPSSRSAQVNALVPDIVARDGQCTLTLSLNGVRRTTTVAAHPTPRATSCGLMSVPGSQLSAGAWQAVVSFRASEGTASSAPVTIQVPA